MSSVLEKNMEALAKYQPQFAFAMPAERGAKSGFSLCKSADGCNNIVCEHKGEKLFIHDDTAPFESAKQQTELITLKGNGLIVSFGVGFGYEAREIIKRMDKGTNFIIAEPCPDILAIVLANSDVTDIISAPNVHFMLYSDKQQAIAYFERFINVGNYGNLAAFVIKSYVSLYFDMCRDLFFVIDDFRMSLDLDESTVKRFTDTWQSNAIKNVKYNINSCLVADFFGRFEEVPAVIVSAGPSLRKNIEQLKGMEDMCLIVSVDTALAPLLSNGVKPHFVVSVDAQELVVRKFDGLDYSYIPLIYVPASSAAVVENHRGTKLLSIVQDNFYRDSIVSLGKNVANIDMGGSVSTTAFSFAQNAGCNPIVLIGQDLAYTGMKSHTEGTAFARDIDTSKINNLIKIEDINGDMVYSDTVMQSYITWFQTYAASDTRRRTYIDATEGGAKILGFEVSTFRDVLDKYMKQTGVNERVSNAINGAPLLSAAEKKQIIKQYKPAIDFIDSITKEAKTAGKQLERIAEMLRKPNPDLTAVASSYKRIEGFERRMRNGNDKLMVIGISLMPIIEKLNIEFENATFKNDLEKNRFAAESYAKYYLEIGDRASSFIDMLREEIQEMHNKKEPV